MDAPDAAPRIEPGTRRELGLVNYGVGLLAGRVVGGTAPNVFTTLGRHRGMFRGWLLFSGKLMPRGVLPRQDTELMILHVATRRGCESERNHHQRRPPGRPRRQADRARR